MIDMNMFFNSTPVEVEEVNCCDPQLDMYHEFGNVRLYNTYYKDRYAIVVVYERICPESFKLDLITSALPSMFAMMGRKVYRITGEHIKDNQIAFMVLSNIAPNPAPQTEGDEVPSDGSEAFAQYCFDGIMPGKKE